MKNFCIFAAALAVVAAISASCAPALLPKPEWKSTNVTIRAIEPGADVFPIDVEWLNAELVKRGALAGGKSSLVIIVRSLKGTCVGSGGNFYFRGTCQVDAGPALPCEAQGTVHTALGWATDRLCARARADAMRKATLVALGLPL
ncbi:MAG: hypothetical protein PHU25_00890 [Deltaproteobacteria bacterium]|nr:hypothetical protein [Deltaproteobacteria bacterium]